MKNIILATTLVPALGLAACASSSSSTDEGMAESATASRPASQPAVPSGDIVDVAMTTGMHNTLVAAVKAAGLVEALKGEGPLTVFAPTDAAFAALPAGTLDDLLKPQNEEKLQMILKYHVVPGRVTAKQAMGVDSADTLAGKSLSVSTMDGKVMVDGATVVKADVPATNGVIHVIDQVVLPE